MSLHPAEITDIRTDFSLLIDGAAASSSSSLDVINPATGLVFARCPAAGRDELDRAVDDRTPARSRRAVTCRTRNVRRAFTASVNR
jgi:acyl-CoA reductase-like NAD-dependent aldehyde dehydrogenase